MEKENTITKYVVAFTDKNGHNVKYASGEGMPSYMVKDGVKYKKKNFVLVENANNALRFNDEMNAKKYRNFILDYRNDLLNDFNITIEKYSVKSNNLSENEVKASFITFIEKVNDWYYSNGSKDEVIKYISNADNVIKMNEIAERIRHMSLPKH